MRIASKIAIVALLWSIFVNPGAITSIDTLRRLNMSHAWWTGTEEGLLNDKLVIRVNDKKYIPYDLGQSMLMLPADWLGSKFGKNFSNEIERQGVIEAAVSFLVFIPINLFSVLTYFKFLQLLNYSKKVAALSSLLWLLGTSFLFYSSFHQQNNQILLFVLLGYQASLIYIIENKKKLAIFSGVYLGIAFLIRITSIIYAISIFIFLIGCITSYKKQPATKSWYYPACLWMSGFIPFLLLERILTYIRYDSWKATSISLHLQIYNKADTLTSSRSVVEGTTQSFPLSNLLSRIDLEALLVPFFAPEKSIFLYDPLVLPCLILLFICWKSFSKIVRWYLISAVIGFLLHLFIYSWTSEWIYQGEWGARYHVTSIHLLLVPLIPLLVIGAKKYKHQNKNINQKIYSAVAKAIILIGILIQFSSILLPYGLEANQQKLEVGSRWRIKQRIENIFNMLTSSNNYEIAKVEEAWQIDIPDRRVTWNLLPFKYQDKIPSNSSARKFVPLLFAFWSIVFATAVLTTIWMFA